MGHGGQSNCSAIERIDLPYGSRTKDGEVPAETEVHAYKQQRAGRVSRATSLTTEDMARFSLKPYLSLSQFALSVVHPRREDSEPTVPSQEEPEVLASAILDIAEPIVGGSNDHMLRREPSLAPTEIEEPEPEDIAKTLKYLNIKVRDFAFPPSSSSSSSSSSSHTLPPVTETFDPFKGIAEYEYRLKQPRRERPIPGKTMRRLICLGWVSMDEVKERLAELDWEELRNYDAKDKEYPWRPVKWTAVPTTDERQKLLESYFGQFVNLDKSRRALEARVAHWEGERKLGMEVFERAEANLKEIEEREMKKQMDELATMDGVEEGGASVEVYDEVLYVSPAPELVSAGKKRALEHTPSTPNANTECRKRVKLSGAVASTSAGPSSSSSSTHPIIPSHPIYRPIPPPQQYPAPLQAYDPHLYPDAARIINAEDRPPVVLPTDPTPPNSDDEEDDGHPGFRLKKKNKGLQRTLSRTQTFTQL